MKKASAFEIIAARCWNLLNEGRPFTPIFVIGAYALYHLNQWSDSAFWVAFGLGLLVALPIFSLYFIFDYPLFLRNYLWFPVIAALLLWRDETIDLGLYGTALGLFFFFTIYFWGTFYYHLRIFGTSWWNFRRFWKLVLKNSDSTSGNAQEQMPKFLLLLFIVDRSMRYWKGESHSFIDFPWNSYVWFVIGLAIYTLVLHRYLFDWKPKEIPNYTNLPTDFKAVRAEKVYVLVVDGMRKDRFEEANAPFMKQMRAQGTEYTQMETVYPARTVVCFHLCLQGPTQGSMALHRIWYGSLVLKWSRSSIACVKWGKLGRLLGIAHLIDSMGDDVESVTAVMHNDKADRNIMERAKLIVSEQNPDLLVVQFIATDQTGHSRGALFDEYREKIEEVDQLIAEFVGWLQVGGYGDHAAYIICADHGSSRWHWRTWASG